MKRKDLLWLLLSPVYVIINTIRHEGSHALAAMAEGKEITKFVFWPGFREGKFSFGYTGINGTATWVMWAAPYLCDLIVFSIAILVILKAKPQRRWLWLNILIIGMVSPLANSLYNYCAKLAGQFNDLGVVLFHLNPIGVHLYFVLTLLFYAWGIYYCYFREKTWHPE
jgi:energy-converting hydrogenase Eha subunit C